MIDTDREELFRPANLEEWIRAYWRYCLFIFVIGYILGIVW